MLSEVVLSMRALIDVTKPANVEASCERKDTVYHIYLPKPEDHKLIY